MKSEYKVEVERDGRWWMVRIPELHGLTQARRLSEAPLMAREWIALGTGTPVADVAVEVVSVTVPGVGNIQSNAEDLAHMRDAAAKLTEQAQKLTADFVQKLTAAGIPVRDTGELLGLSPQRISQLSSA